MNFSRHSGFKLIHRDDLVNWLLAVQSANESAAFNNFDDREKQIFQAGFNAALQAVAQLVGHSESLLGNQTKHKND